MRRAALKIEVRNFWRAMMVLGMGLSLVLSVYGKKVGGRYVGL